MKMLAIVPLLILASCIMECTSAACPSGWKQFEEYCYLAHNYAQNWQLSRLKCRSINADLVKINSVKENEFVLQLVRQKMPSVYAIWIGLYWYNSANRWVWSDISNPVYTNWKTNEPNGNAAEPCGMMYTLVPSPSYPRNGEWNDVACHHNFGLVCKKLA